MGLFTKEEHVQFRDEEGNLLKKPIRTTEGRKSIFASKTPVSDALMKEYYKQHPEEKKSAKAKSALLKFGKKIDNWAVNYNKSAKKRGPMFSFGAGGPMVSEPVFNWGPAEAPPHRKKKKKVKYIIKEGVAYPVGRKHNKKKTHKSKRKRSFDDPFDFEGLL